MEKLKKTGTKEKEIENRIFNIRNLWVMIDRDLAELYGVETKVLNQAVKRYVVRFFEPYKFQLTDFEKSELVTICDRFVNLKHSSTLLIVGSPTPQLLIKPKNYPKKK